MTSALRPLLATRAIPTQPRVAIPTDVTFTDDIDWIAIERAITGDLPRPQLTRDEKLTATLLLIRAGWTEKATAEAVNVDRRQVARWKFEHGLSGASTCTVDDCGDLVKGRGLCLKHYKQDQRRREKFTAPAKRTPHRREPAKCGTRPGYKRHLREGTSVCEGCRTANANYGAERYRTAA